MVPGHCERARSPSHGRPVRTLVRAWVLAGEPEAFFAAGQPFTLWADAIVDDHAVRGEGRLGDGVILGQESLAYRDIRAAPGAYVPPDGSAAAQGCRRPADGAAAVTRRHTPTIRVRIGLPAAASRPPGS
jgi:hypothetical protein